MQLPVVVMSSPLLFLVPCLVFLGVSMARPEDTIWWCNQTPHPDPCAYFVNHSRSNHQVPRSRFDFRKIIVQVTIERALMAQKQVNHFRPENGSRRQEAVWADCMKLHDNTVFQLNRTLEGLAGPNQTCSDFDIQTWLSTALTNIETCRMGSRDLNVSDTMITPATSANLSQLISNSLAVNGALLGGPGNSTGVDGVGAPEGEEFPSWVTLRDRGLLQTSGIRANLVVAKDGSGQFRTVQAAINVAARRWSTSSRFVIYVKRGVYAENVEVGFNNNNIMLIGDGMRNTIITGSRSVRQGYTTYSSATFGTALQYGHKLDPIPSLWSNNNAYRGPSYLLHEPVTLTAFP
ncbi:hypothetical protein SAY87_024270 [Trapa incisa]|uniref:Pectinesterase inhibitor domain-containing protein n=1 Tax=Trapa incisa TaxID=236973 RepID=A0AAN7GPE1_9MYRT|nr:hypothetical protein SAY87_024270 [Trapa incisa]